MLFVLILIVGFVLVVMALNTDWLLLSDFGYDIKKYLQHEEMIEKDLEYVKFVREDYKPKIEERKKAKETRETIASLKKVIFEKMIGNYETLKIEVSEFSNRYFDSSYLSKAEKIEILYSVTKELNLEVTTNVNCWSIQEFVIHLK